MALPVPAFTGFPDGGLDFFRQLAISQNRDWFKAHKDAYELLWLHPMTALFAELHQVLRPGFPELENVSPKVFRIYRDVRFSKNKAPFKTSIAAILPLYAGGDRAEGGTGFYCDFGETPFVAAGRWSMEPDLLKHFRATVAADKTGVPFARAVQKATQAGFSISSMDALKRPPPGFDKAHPRVELLKLKGFALRFPERKASDLKNGRKLRDGLVADLKRITPLLKWLEALSRHTALPKL
jgi:uncharacterized protein (TIGR02453 family)